MRKTIKDLEPEKLALSEDTILEDNVENFQEIEETPEVQYGLDNRNLDHIYKGRNPAHYGLHLRRWIFGENGLSTDRLLLNAQCNQDEPQQPPNSFWNSLVIFGRFNLSHMPKNSRLKFFWD